jgi:hypothetical protein
MLRDTDRAGRERIAAEQALTRRALDGGSFRRLRLRHAKTERRDHESDEGTDKRTNGHGSTPKTSEIGSSIPARAPGIHAAG